MPLRLLIGRTGTGKSTFCLKEIEGKLKESPDGEPIIYLVPEQMTFLSEYKLAKTAGLHGMIRAQVYSFSRLAWRVLQETGGFSRYHVNSIGISMLIRKIIEDKKDELVIYRKTSDKNGFIQQLETLLTEFKRYCVKPEELIRGYKKDKILEEKLHDLEIIYEAFEQTLLTKYIDSEDFLRLLGEKIPQSKLLRDATIYIDGFYSFTPLEYLVIEQLMKNCREITISFTLDRSTDRPDELQLFRQTKETYETIYEMAKVEGIHVEETHFNIQKRFKDTSLQHLEAYFDYRPSISFSGDTMVQLAEASNRRTEIEGIARRIRMLVREKGYRYRDIAIIIRNGSNYYDLLNMIFKDYDIPVFIDQKQPMQNHPLIELVRSTLETINGFWRYEAIFRVVKTELLFPFHSGASLRERMDKFENYVLEYGIQGAKWTGKERWRYRRIRGLELDSIPQTDKEKEIEDEINELKELISAPVIRLSKRLKKAKNGRELAEALYLYLEELEIPRKLENWKMEAEKEGNLIASREHDQAWNACIDLLDQFVEMLGEEELSIRKFATILDAGMDALRFSLVPPAIDQVIVANMENSRLSDIRVAFIPGLNEGVLPAKFSEDGLLADEERERLIASGLKLAPSSKEKLLDEEFIAYKAFTTPSERLYLSYPLANENGKALAISPYVKRMQEIFPNIKISFDVTEISSLSEHEQLDYISHKFSSLSYLATQLALKKRNYPIYDLWWDVYNFYVTDPTYRGIVDKVLLSLEHRNEAKKLSQETSRELYTDVLQGSVSRLEMFSACPFSHFAQYGLRLKERKMFRLDAPDIGDLFHGALKYIVETVVKRDSTWNEMTKDELESLAQEAVEILAPKLQNEILLSSNRYFYIKRKLEQIIQRAALILQEHAKASGFSPIGLELGFGHNQKLPPMTFTLRNGTKMELNGRIDRIDKAEDENGVYLRVIDYKSSAKELNFNEVYHGLALQMLTYLDYILLNARELVGEDALPAGVLYFHVHNPIIQAKRMLTVEELEKEVLKQYKMKGLILAEDNIFRLMDQTIESGESSIISAGLKKDGSFSSRSKVASKEEFDLLRGYVRSIFEKQGNAIQEGKVEISPYKLKSQNACTFCSFKSVCQFDESTEGNAFRKLPVLKNEDILEKIRTGGEIGE